MFLVDIINIMFGHNHFKKNKAGLSLIEVIVSTTLFVIILLSMTDIFQMVLKSQRESIATQNVQESLKYFLEVISKEMRMAQKAEDNECFSLQAGDMFQLPPWSMGDTARNTNTLLFKNYHGECVYYRVKTDSYGDRRFYVWRWYSEDVNLIKAGFLSPTNISIDDLHFIIHTDAGQQPYVSINLGARSVGQEASVSKMRLQTTITSRSYRDN